MQTVTIPQAMQLAIQHHRAGRLVEADAIYRQILAQHPSHPDCLHLLGVIAQQTGRPQIAVDLIRRAIAAQPASAVFHSNLGLALTDRGELDEAIAACRRAIKLQPDFVDAHINLANALTNLGQLDDAVAACRKAIELSPASATAHNNLGNALRDQGHFDEAIAAFCRALDLQPDYANARLSYSLVFLLRGEFERAWPLYQARADMDNAFPSKRNFPQPAWDGHSLNGERVLIHSRQGFGDAIQFIRYAPQIVGRGGIVIVECPPQLVDLFRGAKGVSEVVAIGDSLPPFDLHVPLLSQPLVFGTSIATIPADVPYLTADPVRCEIWRRRIGGDRLRLKVGLAWAGNPSHHKDRIRSIPLTDFLPILGVEGVDFFSLQIDGSSGQIRELPESVRMIDHTAALGNFADTAALLTELDLVISVDTAIVHLAGALGRPVWALLATVSDWRWMLDRNDSPWYPTLRLFRQSRLRDWKPVIAGVQEQLERLARRSVA